MTLEERRQKANSEYRALIKAEQEEVEKVTAELKRTGKYKYRPDTNREAYAPIHEEYKRRALALFDKYDLPNKPKL